MAKIDLSEILNKQVGTAPEPKPLPQGTYQGEIATIPTARSIDTKDGKRLVIGFKVNILEAMDDVIAEELEAAGGVRRSTGEPKTIVHDVWVNPENEESFYGLDQLLAAFGYNKDSGKSYTEVFEELPSKTVTILLAHREYNDRSGQARVAVDVKRLYGTEN